ncbi:PKD domain-containing protein [Actinotalea fermentans]|uniref:PKD domain-containing protein n=1 Tax=Actinotalea fermentans TaxID=43671 RepID=UPI001649E5E7|nr:PKD domain-containing protein [Actinotalea fermentans]
MEFERRPECDPERKIAGVCFPGTPEEISIRACGGDPPVLPLWSRTRATPASPWSGWVNIIAWTCPDDPVPTLTGEDFRRLPLAPPPLTIQPDRTQHLVNLPTIVYTTPTTQTLTATLLGYPLEVEATPTTYTWDFGDGTTLTTTSPGHPYPHHDIAHPYPQPGTYTITLTTTLTGRYRLTGTTTWTPITGTATTTTTAPPITTTEAPTHLVTTDCHHTTTC